MFSYFKNRKTTYFDVFCLNFIIETKIKTLFLNSYFNLSKKRNGTLGTRITLFQIRNVLNFELQIANVSHDQMVTTTIVAEITVYVLNPCTQSAISLF